MCVGLVLRCCHGKWMGDAHAGLSSDSMLLNFHMDSFLPHYTQLMSDDQVKGPTLPDVVPFYRYGTRPADPSWGAAFPQLVWALYHYYGDLVTAKALYPSVMAYVQFMLSTIPSSGIGNMYGYYGDWVPPPPQPKVSVSFTSAFSFLLNVKQTLELAQALGQQNDVATLTSMFTTQSASFNKAFFNGQSYSSGLQITYVLPLYLGIVPADSYDTVVANFLNQFVGSDHTHITAGIIGTKFLLPVLSLVNRSDLALEVVQQPLVEKLCIGKNTCVVPTDEAMWGGVVCQGQTRWMVVSVQCRSGDEVLGDDFKFSSITVNVSVPVGSVGVVYLPAHGKGQLSVWEGQHRGVWSDRVYLGGGVRGLQGGEWVSELDAIKLNVLPGRYSFTVKGQ
ncbi:hypothetical protein EMCRGX_G002768 [Ephydatia muelleri]